MKLFSKKDLYKLIIPLIFEQILGVTVGMADSVMVSYAGQAALSGVSLVDTLNILLINIFNALATGGAVVAARFIGEKNEKEACRAANQLLLTVAILASAIMAIALIWNQQLLHAIYRTIETPVMYNASVYFYLTAFSYPFLAIYSGCAGLCRSMGNSRITLITSVIVNVTNLIGNAVLVYGLGMAAGGVGTATLVSRIVGAAVMTAVIHNQRHPIHIDAKFRLGYHPYMIKKILHIGVPTGLDSCIFQVGKLLVQSLVSGFGTASIAANAIANTISGFVVIPASSIGLAITTVVGQSAGARDFVAVKEYTKKLMKAAYAAMAILNIGVIIFSSQIVGLFALDPEASVMAWQIIVAYSICATLLWPMSFTLPNALRAVDDAKYIMYVSIASMWIFRVGLSYVLHHFFHFDLFGTWAAMFVDWVFRSLFFMIRIKVKWKHPEGIERIQKG